MRTTTQVRTKVAPPQPVIVPMDPRIRRRRVEVRRDEGRRRLRIAMIGLLIVTLSVGAWVVVRSPLLDVDRVQVDGVGHTPAQAIVRQAGVHGGQAMVDVDEAGAARRVETLPWVAHAQVSRRWPATVRITVTERRAVAVTSADGGWVLLDAGARVLEVDPERPPGLVALGGVGPATPPGTELLDAKGLLSVVTDMSPSLAARTTSVEATDGGEVELKLNPRGTVRLGPPDDLPAKLAAVETVLAKVSTANLSTLDVRLPSSPVLTRG